MFCRHCGTQLRTGFGFCSNCGAARREDAAPLPVSARPAAPRKPLKNRMMDAMRIPAALLLLLVGSGYMTLFVAGRAVTAQVIGVERMHIVNNDESTGDSRRYKLDYAFSAGGERYTGSVTRVSGGGSQMRSTIPVRYLPFWPHVNAEDSAAAGLTGPVLVGLGILLLVYGMRERHRLRNKGRQAA